MRIRLIATVASAALLGCGSSSSPYSSQPIAASHGGPVLRSPKLVTITYANYEFRDEVEAFGDFVVRSDWLNKVGNEYGVGHGEHQAVRLDSPEEPASSDDLEQSRLLGWIKSQQVPAPDAQTLYMIYIPSATRFVGPDGTQACTADGGYHSVAVAAGALYAIIYDCGLLDGVTALASHELIETATDPAFSGFYAVWDPKLPVSEEVADLCQNNEPVDEGGFKVTRSWSNAAARNGQDPCVPAPAGVYYTVFASPSRVPDVKPGDVVTFDLLGYASRPIDPWVLIPIPGAQSKIKLGVSLSQNRIAGGGHVKLTLTVPADATPGVGYVDIFSAPDWVRVMIVGVRIPSLLDGQPFPSDGEADLLAAPFQSRSFP
jgi:hypothetical protein